MSIKSDPHNLITAKEYKTLIETNVKAILDNPKVAHALPPIMCWGSPGIGKSAVVKEVAEELGIDFIDVRLAQMEPCDIKGLPVPDDSTKTMNWYVNGSWPTDKNGKGILFLDELSSCDRSVAVAAYELILDRRLGKLYKVPDGYYIVGAGNLTTDRAVATTMSSALANRFMHVEIQADPDVWLEWGRLHDIHPSVLGYIGYKPESLFNMEGELLDRGWPSPRAWERVSQVVRLWASNEEMMRKSVYGLVGPAKGIEFMAFHKLNKKFDNVLDMMYGKVPFVFPAKNDEKHALCSTLIYLLWKATDEADQQKRLDGFFKMTMEMTSDFAAMCMIGALNGNGLKPKDYCTKALYNNKHFKEWRDVHGSALKKRYVK